ncbi:MAG: efflux RND transporter permease subunit, partial [Gemmatimonadetes bacterium]|nr:efflux RND transporter permease subunit [Gemmatimonadota bacterium]
MSWLSIAVILANIPLYKLVKQDYIPTNVDESEFEVNITAKEGASIAAMDATMREAERRLLDIEGIDHMLCTVGSRGLGSVNRGEFFVRLQDIETRTFSWERLWNGVQQGDWRAAFRGNFTQQQKMQEIRKLLGAMSNCRISVRNLTSLRQGAPVDIDFSITGPNIDELVSFSERLRTRAMDIEGIVDVDTTLKLDKPELRVQIDRERAAAMGIDVQEIADTLRIAVGGDDRVSRYRDRSVDDAFDVELRLVGIDRADVDSISQLYVRAPQSTRASGAATTIMPRESGPVLTRLDNVVSFEFGEDASRIDRLDRQRMVAVRANIESGHALADRIEALNAAAAEVGIPPGVTTRALGRARELDRTLQEFVWTFALSF